MDDKPAPSSLSESLKWMNCTLEEMNKKVLEFVENVTTNAEEIQVKVLKEILTRNADAEYLKRCGLKGHTDQQTFKKVVPMTTYENLASDIQRISNGDTSPILCSDPIIEFMMSTGTSGGGNKLFPMTEYEVERRPILRTVSNAVMCQRVDGFIKGKSMTFYFARTEFHTPGGTLARTGQNNFLKNPNLGTRWFNIYSNLTSPKEIILCTDYFQCIYSQALCGLSQRTDVVEAGAVFASNFVRAIKFIKKHWQMLANDLEMGTPDPTIVTDPTVRKMVIQTLGGPKPNLAEIVKAECEKDSWKGIIRRLWPNIKFINAIVTGTMEKYIPTLDYYSDGLPLVTSLYVNSECCAGVNLNPLCNPSEVAFTLFPSEGYYEFLPVEPREALGSQENDENKALEERKDEMKLVDLANVELGKEYEIVVTTFAGLYRYRLGDILRVAGFKNKAPQFNFVRRRNVILSIASEGIDEVELRDAFKKANNHLLKHQWSLVEYSIYADTSTIPGHYVLFLEISKNDDFNDSTDSALPASVLEDCCLEFEESLNSEYRFWRVKAGMIGPLEIRVVKDGTFDELMDLAVSGGTAIGQYKTPICVKNPRSYELLESRVVSKHFSTRCPKLPVTSN